MSGLIQHAKDELKYAGYTPLEQEQEEGPNKWIQENILEIVEVFGRQEHSGFSASYCVSALERLLRLNPLTALTGAEEEWTEVSDGLFQNKRMSSVFKKNGVAYDIDYRVFTEKAEEGNLVRFGNYLTRERVYFPYYPSEYPDVIHRPSLEYFSLWVKYKLGVNKDMWD